MRMTAVSQLHLMIFISPAFDLYINANKNGAKKSRYAASAYLSWIAGLAISRMVIAMAKVSMAMVQPGKVFQHSFRVFLNVFFVVIRISANADKIKYNEVELRCTEKPRENMNIRLVVEMI